MRLASALLSVLILGSCSSPPAPPNVDESRKRPANTRAAIDLQVCNGDLQDARSSLAAGLRDTAAARTSLSRLAALRNPSSATCVSGIDSRSTVHSIVFPFAGSRVNLSPAQGEQLIRAARTAPLILLRGRTDGTADNPADSRIARERAEAVRVYLVAAGIRPAQIRTTWQPVGDFVADNSTANGRALNRRVEVEIYRVAPRFAAPEPSTLPAQATLGGRDG